MNFKVTMLVLTSVSLAAFAQIVLKLGMSSPKIQQALNDNISRLDVLLAITFNTYVIIGLVMYGVGAFVWLLVLAKLEVTLAYPFVGLGMIFTMLLGVFFLGESINTPRLLGTLLVIFGVILVSRS